jgi:hypothetical protein
VRSRAVAAAAVVGVASLVIAPSPASSQAGVHACTHGYAYAGVAGRAGGNGVGATIGALRMPSVPTGHAAAWVGVGGIHAGPGGASEWLQAGVAAFPRVGLHLYVEEVSRGEARRFVDLGPALVGRRYHVRIVETRPDFWQAFLNGRAAGDPAYLPTAGGSWRPVATAESWTAGGAACNRYAYRFDAVTALRAGRWRGLGAPERIGAGVIRRRSGFLAVS